MSVSAVRARGFTLLELLIVLVLIGMVAALVVPGLSRTYDAIVSSGERADTVRAFERLPLRVRDSGRDLVLEPGDAKALTALLELAPGWTATLVEPLRIERTGVCHPAKVKVTGRTGAVETWVLTAPGCAVRDAL